jgi:putative hydrolase of the HAD superfamily
LAPGQVLLQYNPVELGLNMPMNIVFDFGAVVFSWRPLEIVRSTFPRHAASAEAAGQLAADIFHHADWQDFDRGMLEQAAVIERAALRLNLPHQDVQSLVASIPQHLTPLQGTVELLSRLRERRERLADIRLYFLSNMPQPYARVLEQRNPFLQWFDGGFFSGDVKLIKPQPEIFRMLESHYQLDCDRTVFIDDLPANVAAARAHGWQALHFESASQVEPLLAALLA